ncbi:TetR/AcrR family transcriptional regulator [Streptomyces hainanensis]|uniref:TetR/AcrR family transcriptional regulator n=1 Tax=Streptomyces hainanensis TaxID=402648 RepID=A0A4V2XZZ2_9ACTN|nr:TetR/AcrR family transcriptional regulator [Streptomyces hainanensis]TDC62875.1 TetR/AcrR family transcriptional regulator [Streptomyces hainanensis]
MARLTRVQQQARTRAAVLAAARREFVEYGYGAAKIDRIAERAELTRGAVYSNFPGKRALYLAVLVEMVERAWPSEAAARPDSVPDALGRFARVWLERLPLVDDTAAGGRLQLRSLVGVVDDGPARAVLTQIARLEALLLAMGLEECEPGAARGRRVRLAELVLTLLGGSGLLAELTPGFGDPFDRTRACEHLAGLDLGDVWAPPHLPYVEPGEPCRDGWDPPSGLVDRLTGGEVDLGAEGLVTVLGAGRLSAAEEAVRSVPPGEQVTVAVVTAAPAETGGLVRLRVSDLAGCLRRVFPPEAWRGLRLVVDDEALVATALGLTAVDDETEAAVRVRGGAIVARASGRSAGYATTLTRVDGGRSREATP